MKKPQSVEDRPEWGVAVARVPPAGGTMVRSGRLSGGCGGEGRGVLAAELVEALHDA
jgi:hypothetical protein